MSEAREVRGGAAMEPSFAGADASRRPAGAWRRKRKTRSAAGALESAWLSLPAVGLVALGFLIPLAILLAYTFFPTVDSEVRVWDFTLENYDRLFTQSPYLNTLLETFAFVGLASLLTVVVACPFAYFVAFRVRPSRRLFWILVAVVPFGTSYLIRVFAWLNLFGEKGLINDGLQRLDLINAPIGLLDYGRPAIVITFIYLLFPLAFLSTYIAFERINPSLMESAADLGARGVPTLLRVTLPLAKGGLLAGFAFSFITMVGDYVTPTLIGGTKGSLYANLMINQFGISVQWGFGATLALTLLVAMFLLFWALRLALGGTPEAGQYTRGFVRKRSPLLTAYSGALMFILYVPIAIVILLALNDAKYVGFPINGLTFRWFQSVFENQPLLDALTTSLQVAGASLLISLCLGGVAAVQLSRARGRWRDLSLSVIGAPVLLPPVVLALGLLIGLNAAGLERGLWTIILGHTLLILPVVTLLIVVRLEGLDRDYEMAAMDLGARPYQALLRVALPQALPGIVAAALIGFALSMDEFILTFLVTGSQTTLPLYIYGALRFQITPELNAVSSLMLLASLVLVVVGFVLAIGRERLRGRGGGGLTTKP